MNIVVTGGNRGLGYELIAILHENGHTVFPVVRKQEVVDELIQKFPNRCYPITADLNFDTSTKLIQSEIKKYVDTIDIVINNAGIPGEETELLHVTSDELLSLFNVHCLGVVRVVKGTFPFLLKSTSPKVMNISSRLGSLSKMASGEFQHGRFSYSYRIAKAAQNMLTLCMEMQFREHGIEVIAIHPGKLKTEIGAEDANLSPRQGAENIYHWIVSASKDESGRFIEPSVGELNW